MEATLFDTCHFLMYYIVMTWEVDFTAKAEKQALKLPSENLKAILATLIAEIELNGPKRTNWKNYSKLSAHTFHCHIKTGKPTYVVCWRVENKKVKLTEVYYVGTHEKAPY